MNFRSIAAPVLLLSCVPVDAQTLRGSIWGQITDQTRQAVEQARVSVTSLENARTRLAFSDSQGFYRLS